MILSTSLRTGPQAGAPPSVRRRGARLLQRPLRPLLRLALRLTVTAGLAAASLASQAVAQPVGPWEQETGFLIETITVEGLKRASPELIVAESLLEAGRTYSESELRDAADRVRRLPFVLDAVLSLRRGSRRGTYELVIEVQETRRFFFGTTLDFATFASPLRLEDRGRASTVPTTDRSDGVALIAGVRFFVGSRGEAFAALRDIDGFEVGYAHHDLFGRHVFAGVNLARDSYQQRIFPLGLDPTLDQWTLEETREAQIEVAVPLSARQAVRLGFAFLESEEARGRPLLSDRRSFRFLQTSGLEQLQLSASWVFDTRDDPILPTRGASASAGLTAETLTTSDSLWVVFLGPFGIPRTEEPVPDLDSLALTAVGSGTRHWPITRRQTLSLGLRASLGRSRIEGFLGDSPDGERRGVSTGLTAFEASAALRWSLDLRRPRRLGRGGDLRFELGAAYGLEGTSPSLGLTGNPFEKLDLEAALVYRNGWGLFRLELSYLDGGEILR